MVVCIGFSRRLLYGLLKEYIVRVSQRGYCMGSSRRLLYGFLKEVIVRVPQGGYCTGSSRRLLYCNVVLTKVQLNKIFNNVPEN